MPRQALLAPIPEIFEAAAYLLQAAEAAAIGERERATELIIKADMTRVRDYTERAWGAGSKGRFNFLVMIDEAPRLALDARLRPRMPTQETRREVLKRDGRHCRFCGIPVISPIVRRAIQLAYPQAVSWGATNASQHAAFQCMWLQFDHIIPSSRGGSSEAGNIVITCAPCNFGRMESTLAEADLEHPLAHPTPKRWNGFYQWDGLEGSTALGGSSSV